MKYYLLLYVATLVIMGLFDFLWLGVIAQHFYKNRLAGMLEFQAVPAILFYLLYGVAILIFVNGGSMTQWQPVLAYGALFGFFAYMTYDLTNMATLKGWSWPLVVVDILWGMLNTGASATIGWLLAKRIIGAA